MALRKLFRLSGREPPLAEDIAAEFEAHLQMKIDVLVRNGLSPAEARREAESRFGSLERFARECRMIDQAERKERRRREWWSALRRDLGQAGRALRRAPGFTLTAVLVLALGIGLVATVFSVLRSVVLRPLPFPGAERIVAIHSSHPGRGLLEFSASVPDFLDWRAETGVFRAMTAWAGYEASATGMGEAERVPAVAVTADYTAVTGVVPARGRWFAPAEFAAGGPRVAIIAHEAWTSRFGRDPAILGRQWILDGEPREIIGVMPPGFRFPVQRIDVWLPFRMPEDVATQRGAHYLTVAGRLADGATLESAAGRLVALAARLERDYPRSNTGWTVLLRPLHEEVVRDARPTLLLLMTGVGLLLLLACSNVANLVLVRSIRRSGEVAVRSALGAGRQRLVWHAVSEVLVLVGAGALAAVPVALLGTGLIRRIAPAGVPRIEAVQLDLPVLLVALGITALVAVLVSLTPARRILRADLRGALSGTRSVGGHRGLHRWLVATETAVALALLAIAGVLIKSKQRLESVDPGFDPSSTLVASVALPGTRYPSGDHLVRFQQTLLEQVEALPGVESAALIFGLPLTGFGWSGSFVIDSVPVPDHVTQSAQLRIVSRDYFATQGVSIREGRGFGTADRRDSRRVLVVSETAMRRYWPDGKPLGHWVRMGVRPGDDRPEGEIVGVVADLREDGLDREARPIVYALSDQVAVDEVSLVVRTRIAPLALAPEVRRTLAALDPDLPLSGVRTMESVVRDATAPQRFRTWLMGFFAALAAGLAGLGVYGVIAHIVAQRTRELGLRRALGATDRQVTREVVRSGMRDAGLGAVAGLALGWLITRQLSALLYQVGPGDPLVLGGAAALFLGIALIACWIPARRAIKADPALVLRGE
jgi:putative ABC transport system permease protein